uniref:Uncharacterized protein n=1 Tax=Romanomermis culicivorax TaxID=13658 RepID=A0A915JQ73_ROMCU
MLLDQDSKISPDEPRKMELRWGAPMLQHGAQRSDREPASSGRSMCSMSGESHADGSNGRHIDNRRELC